ncbi:transglycosylase domain-containing protein [Propionibacterium freudenreichii]|uniref:transglycosylase domain-containing protein n=1 Tax=Propionibacterium freudenreichii TaxID=1744 RepID=UPI0021A7CEE7|nr:transglycosylase domain-containing protein [Propionibacterium freudenreichii]MDK9351396.1 penicillin-binding protein [Propionibacterium freudenreichii]
MADRKKSRKPRRALAPSASQRHGPHRTKKKASRARRVVTAIAITLATLMIVGVLGSLIFYARVKLPDPNADFNSQTSTVLFRDGSTKLGELAIQNRTMVDYSAMSDNVKAAVVAAEDRSFWSNKGVSPKGIVRSLFQIARGKDLQSGSTITQQYIKIRYLTSKQTMSRKLTELALAVKMNREVSKDEILAGYLNTVYFGRNAYGVEKAATTYFGTNAAGLNVPQSAMLSALVNSPSTLDPANGDDAKRDLTERYDYVLDGMLEAGKISQADHDANYDKLPDTLPVTQSDLYGGTNGFLLTMAEQELRKAGFSEEQIDGGGLTITTTFDQKMQDAAVKTATDNVSTAIRKAKTNQDASTLHAAVASIGVGTGEVYALYGGPDFLKSQINWATTARPAASTFKAWALVAGLRNGFTLNSTLTGSTFTPNGDNVVVRNDGGVNYGSVTLQKATSYSMNTAFTDLEQRMPNGPADTVKAANDAGVPTGDGWDLNNRIALGTGQVSPVDNATGFATLANDGQRNTTHVVKEVKDASGKVVYTGDTSATQTIDASLVHNAQTALESVVTSGTGTEARQLGRQVIAKTGTKDVDDQTVSAWFVGATKQISTAVMFVAGDGNANLDPYAASGAFESDSYPAYLWEDYMEQASQGMDRLNFNTNAPTQAASVRPSVRRTPTPSVTASATPEAPAANEPAVDVPTAPPASPEPTPAGTVGP